MTTEDKIRAAERRVLKAADAFADGHVAFGELEEATAALRALRSPLPSYEDLDQALEGWDASDLQEAGVYWLRWGADQMRENGPIFYALPGSPSFHSAFKAGADWFRARATELEER